MGIVKDLARSPRPKGAAGATLEGLYLSPLPQGRSSIPGALKGSIFQIEPPNRPFDRRCGIGPAADPQENTRGPRPWTPARGKGLKIQGVIVRATRNPLRSPRSAEVSQPRFAERRFLGSLNQDPPRKTRREQSPRCHADPSAEAPR